MGKLIEIDIKENINIIKFTTNRKIGHVKISFNRPCLPFN